MSIFEYQKMKDNKNSIISVTQSSSIELLHNSKIKYKFYKIGKLYKLWNNLSSR